MNEDNSHSEQHLDGRIAGLRASIAHRTAELQRRAAQVRHAADVRGLIARHPWPAVAVGLTAGVMAGALIGGRRKSSGAAAGSSGGADSVARSLLGSFAFALAAASLRRFARHLVEQALQPAADSDRVH